MTNQTNETMHGERPLPVGPILVVIAVITIALACALIFVMYRAATQAEMAAVMAQEQAQVQRARAEASAAFLTEVLAEQDPATGADVTRREVLDGLAADLESRFDRPELEAFARTTLARGYRDLGDVEKARELYETAWALSKDVDVILATMIASDLADLYTAEGKPEQAERWRDRAPVKARPPEQQ